MKGKMLKDMIVHMKYLRPDTLFRELIKKHTRTIMGGNEGRLLGLDVRDNYAEFALSDRSNLQCHPSARLKIDRFDLVEKHIPNMVSKHNVFGIVVAKPLLPHVFHEDSNEIQVRKFISDLRKSDKFKGLKYTYWCDDFASKHRESAYKSFVDAYVRDNVLPLHEVDSRVKKWGAVGTLQAFMDHFWDVETDYQNAKIKRGARSIFY